MDGMGILRVEYIRVCGLTGGERAFATSGSIQTLISADAHLRREHGAKGHDGPVRLLIVHPEHRVKRVRQTERLGARGHGLAQEGDDVEAEGLLFSAGMVAALGADP